MFALSRVGQILGAVGSIAIHAYALAFLVEPLGQVIGLQLAWSALIISLALNLALIAATAWVKLTASREDYDAEGIARPNRRDPKLSKTRAIFTLSSSVVILLLVTVLYTTGYTNTDSCNFTVGTVELTGVPCDSVHTLSPAADSKPGTATQLFEPTLTPYTTPDLLRVDIICPDPTTNPLTTLAANTSTYRLRGCGEHDITHPLLTTLTATAHTGTIEAINFWIKDNQ